MWTQICNSDVFVPSSHTKVAQFGVFFFFLSRSYNYFLCPQFDLASILVYEDIKKYMLSHFPKGKLAGSLYSRRVRIVEFLQFNYIPWTSL